MLIDVETSAVFTSFRDNTDVQPTQWTGFSWDLEWLIDDLTWIYQIILASIFGSH